MKDTRDEINESVANIWQKVTERLNDPDDDFEYAYANYSGEDILASKFAWWLKGTAMFVQEELTRYESDISLYDLDLICSTIGETYLKYLIGENEIVHLRRLLVKEELEINELYDDEPMIDDLEDLHFGGDDDDQG